MTQREIPKVPALRGKTVVSLFYEDSTRTRLSFETAAKRLSADTMSFSVSTVVGEEGREPARHRADDRGDGHRRDRRAPRRAGAPRTASRGGSTRAWSTRATAATSTRRRRCSTRSRCAATAGRRSTAAASRSSATSATPASPAAACRRCATLGAEVTLVGPPTLLPESLDGWPVTVVDDLDDVLARGRRRLPAADPAGAPRRRRCFPSLREYTTRYGLTAERAARLKPDTLVMHPGPMNRGRRDRRRGRRRPASLVTEQVANGVAVRMAVLWSTPRIGRPHCLTTRDPRAAGSSTRPASATPTCSCATA